MVDALVLYDTAFGVSVTATGPVYGTGASLAGGLFDANKDYLIIAYGYVNVASASQELLLRLQQDGVTVTDGAWAVELDNSSNPINIPVGGIRRISQGSTPTDVTLDPGASGTADVTADVFLFAIALDDLGTEGVDWVWDEVTTDYATTTTFNTSPDAPSVAIGGAGDWLMLADDTVRPGDATNDHQFRLRDVTNGVTLTQLRIEGEDVAVDVRGHILMAVLEGASESDVIEAQTAHDAGTAGTVFSSRIFGVNLARFAQSTFAKAAGPTSPTSMTTVVGVDPTPDTTGDWVILGHLTHTIVSYAESQLSVRLQVNAAGGGLVSNPAYGDDAPAMPGFDPTNTIHEFPIGTVVALSSGAAREINLDIQFNNGATSSAASNMTLVAFSVALAAAGPPGDVLVGWFSGTPRGGL